MGWPHLRLRKVLVSGLAPPEAEKGTCEWAGPAEVENMKGVNEACVTSWMPSSQVLFCLMHGDGERQQRRGCGLRVNCD